MDPLGSEFAAWSSFLYSFNNPIRFIDPDGMAPEDWIENGDGTWTAEAGDGAETLAQDAGISVERAYEIMEQQCHGTYIDLEDGVTKSAVDPGDIVTVPEHVEVIKTDEKKYKIKRDIALQNDKTDPGTTLGLVRGGVLDKLEKKIEIDKANLEKKNQVKDSLINDSKRIKDGGK